MNLKKEDPNLYNRIHRWAKEKIAKPSVCNRCKEYKPLEMSNNSRKYMFDVSDWEWICHSCHAKKDRWSLGIKRSEEHKRKMSLINSGQIPWNKGKKVGPYSQERMEKVWAGLRGKPAWNRGLKISQAQREKLSLAHVGQKAWNKGKPMSEESKKKLSNSLKGKVPWNKGIKSK